MIIKQRVTKSFLNTQNLNKTIALRIFFPCFKKEGIENDWIEIDNFFYTCLFNFKSKLNSNNNNI